MNLLFIDNYDSFTYNLVQFFGTLPATLRVYRNDKIDLAGVRALNPDKIVISPGPCTPHEAGVSNDIIREFHTRVPILGVCLGHQCIGHVFGAVVNRNERIMHGKVSPVRHNGDELFAGMSNPFQATRYHSLVVRRETLPPEIVVTAWTDEGEVMGLRHRDFPLWGVQFHPESVLTPEGQKLMANFFNARAPAQA